MAQPTERPSVPKVAHVGTINKETFMSNETQNQNPNQGGQQNQQPGQSGQQGGQENKPGQQNQQPGQGGQQKPGQQGGQQGGQQK
jgi:hypothetical protein